MYLRYWHGWCPMKLLPSQHVLCTPYNHAPCHFMQSHICKMHVYLAVTSRLHFWQNDRGLSQGWNEYRNKSQHRRLTLENKIILPPLQDRTCDLDHKSGAVTTELSLLPTCAWQGVHHGPEFGSWAWELDHG